MKPNPRDMHIPCPGCKLMDFFIVWNESTSQSAVVCQNCGARFMEIQWSPTETPDPSVVI